MARKPTKSLFEIVGDVEPEMALELDTVERGIQPPPLVKIRSQHHALARLLAAGLKPGEAAIVCGLSSSRVSILQNDPTFQELLTFFQNQKSDLVMGMMDHVRDLGMDALLEMRDRLTHEPEKISNGDLLNIINSNLDRLGYSPAQKHVHVHTDLGRIKDAVDSARRGKVVQADRRAGVGGAEQSDGPIIEGTIVDPEERIVVPTPGGEDTPDAVFVLVDE